MNLRLIDVNRIVRDHPSLVSIDDFGVAGADSDNDPLYRFSYLNVCFSDHAEDEKGRPHTRRVLSHGRPGKASFTPTLPEKAPPKREGRSGTHAIGDLLSGNEK